MIEDQKLKNLLLKDNLIDEEVLKIALKESQKKQISLFYYLLDKNLVDTEVLFSQAAAFFKIPLINLKNESIRKDVLFLIPEPIAQTHEIVAFNQNEKGISIATTDPTDLQTIEFLRKKYDKNLIIHLTTPQSIRNALKQYHQSLEAEFEDISKSEIDLKEKGKDLEELAKDLPLIRIVDTLLEYAIFEEASDIHIEPTEKHVIVRYRIDGLLKDVMTLPKTVQSGVVARIKVLSNLKLDEHRLPQDGRFKISSPQYKVAFRVSVLPVFNGEKIVLRLLNESTKILSLEDLGFQKVALEILKTNIKKPHGIILVTGPTGSGKTTTLYTIMNILNKPEVNITTVEDPIEYRMPKINQSQINPKIDYTFATGLRAILRQDPNIIMVGEIRDKETAEIAINAAMTGHLVLSTVHTNDVATTPQRLFNMGVQPFLVASTTILILAQRLIRKVCKNCMISYNLDKEIIDELNRHFNLKVLQQFLISEGLISSQKDTFESILFYKGKGCKQCGQRGYKGRIGIYEVLEISPVIAELIASHASSEEIQKQAVADKMLTLTQDGFMKCIKGITTIEEVLRVTQE
ncbi:GspE/PulE family protein [Patescibacteria group bacterium]|nr:GspE/PulE family protein [Patescibacteria group bacterium]